MRLHELYFGNLGGKEALKKDSPLMKRLEENFALFDFALTDAEMQEIHRLSGRKGRIVDWTWSPKWD